MTAYLPPQLVKLFLPRPPLALLPPIDRSPPPVKICSMSRVGDVVHLLRDSNHNVQASNPTTPVAPKPAAPKPVAPKPVATVITRTSSLAERRKRRNSERIRVEAKRWRKSLFAPRDCNTADPFKTLIVYNLAYETTERQLYHALVEFGEIKTLRVVEDKSGKSRGYGFVEFVHENDMKAAFKHAYDMKLDGRRIRVDVERGRTVNGWKPRRLGGGLGGRR